MESERGFTLIELMIVVAIIAILAAILIPNFTHARAQAQTAACESNLREISTAAELYYTDNQVYPSGTNVPVNTALAAGYLNNTPHDPAALSPESVYTYSDSGGASTGSPGYTITCPGVHEATTINKLPGPGGQPGGSYHTITYSSGTGLGAK